LVLTLAARDWLATKGYDIEYGARPLKRLIRRELEDKLALGVVAGEFRSGGGRVLVDVDTDQDGHLTIKREGTQVYVSPPLSHVAESSH
jgi:ATP-dependent Clp protease ATP-binding subunit ClpB